MCIHNTYTSPNALTKQNEEGGLTDILPQVLGHIQVPAPNVPSQCYSQMLGLALSHAEGLMDETNPAASSSKLCMHQDLKKC
jgi:hypothetical protein